MKSSRYVTTVAAVLLSLVISGATAFAQETEQEKAAAKKAAVEKAVAQGSLAADIEGKIQAELFTVLDSKLAFETKLVKGAPYSAVTVSESVQTLGDGNRIRQTTTTTVYRDSAGRIRREVMSKDGTPKSVVISDPASGINYSLDPQNRTAMKSEFGGMVKMVDLARGEEMKKVELARSEERKMKLDQEEKLLLAKTVPYATLSEKKQTAKEMLGSQRIEGVEAEGTRVTITIPAGQIGNDLPINIVSEQWYSPELQLLVMTKHSDPRTGETTYRLTNINRAEPDHSLFELPADYTLRNMYEEKLDLEKKVRDKVAKPEEK
ncbi:MAG: hypothetical protein JST85_19175 [Acidobacteria bacterium]|nr:hypothetical protein [Acidobacteriota bacterium]